MALQLHFFLAIQHQSHPETNCQRLRIFYIGPLVPILKRKFIIGGSVTVDHPALDAMFVYITYQYIPDRQSVSPSFSPVKAILYTVKPRSLKQFVLIGELEDHRFSPAMTTGARSAVTRYSLPSQLQSRPCRSCQNICWFISEALKVNRRRCSISNVSCCRRILLYL